MDINSLCTLSLDGKETTVHDFTCRQISWHILEDINMSEMYSDNDLCVNYSCEYWETIDMMKGIFIASTGSHNKNDIKGSKHLLGLITSIIVPIKINKYYIEKERNDSIKKRTTNANNLSKKFHKIDFDDKKYDNDTILFGHTSFLCVAGINRKKGLANHLIENMMNFGLNSNIFHGYQITSKPLGNYLKFKIDSWYKAIESLHVSYVNTNDIGFRTIVDEMYESGKNVRQQYVDISYKYIIDKSYKELISYQPTYAEWHIVCSLYSVVLIYNKNNYINEPEGLLITKTLNITGDTLFKKQLFITFFHGNKNLLLSKLETYASSKGYDSIFFYGLFGFSTGLLNAYYFFKNETKEQIYLSFYGVSNHSSIKLEDVYVPLF